MTLYPNLILDALRNVRYPASGKDIVSAGMVEDDIRIDGMKVSFSLIFDRPTDPFIKSLVKAAETATVSYSELLFDLIYVFSVTQLSHYLLHNLTWEGLLKETILWFAVWMLWQHTIWVTNWFNPDTRPLSLIHI